MQLGLRGHAREGFAEDPLAVGIAALPRIELRQHDIGRHETGIERARGQILGLGRGGLPLLGIEVAEVDPGLGPVGVEPLRRHVVVDRAGQPVPVRRRQPVLRHRRQQRGRLEPDAAHRVVEQAARERPALLDRQAAPARAARPAGPAGRHRPGPAAPRRAPRGSGGGPGPRARWRARSPAQPGRPRAAAATAPPPPYPPAPRQKSRSRSESPCGPARASARWPRPPRPRPGRRGSRCRRWRRRSARTDPAGGCGSHDRGAGRRPCRSAPACGRRGSLRRANPPHGGGARPYRTSPPRDTGCRRRCPGRAAAGNAARGSRCRSRPR